MTQLPRRRIAVLLTSLVLTLISGISTLHADEIKVVATTEWTAAFCRAAGLENVHVLAPANLQHPPDYELRPTDIPVIMEADLIVYAGYEGMMERIRANIAGDETELLQIKTVYSPQIIRESVVAIATAADMVSEAEENLIIIEEAWEQAGILVSEAGLAWKPAAVHVHQGALAWTLGIFEVATFGPAPPGAGPIAAAAESGAVLIIDNQHNPVSAPLQEVLPDAVVVELINFPGAEGTRRLEEVILFNATRLAEAFR